MMEHDSALEKTAGFEAHITWTGNSSRPVRQGLACGREFQAAAASTCRRVVKV